MSLNKWEPYILSMVASQCSDFSVILVKLDRISFFSSASCTINARWIGTL